MCSSSSKCELMFVFCFVFFKSVYMDKGLYFQTLFPGAKRVFAPLRLYVEVYNAKLHQTL